MTESLAKHDFGISKMHFYNSKHHSNISDDKIRRENTENANVQSPQLFLSPEANSSAIAQ